MRAIPGDNLAYPIQITLENGSQGSGFYLHEENQGYLITAAHVLLNQDESPKSNKVQLLSYTPDFESGSFWLFEIDLNKALEDGGVLYDLGRDIIVINLSERTFSVDDTGKEIGLNRGKAWVDLKQAGQVSTVSVPIRNIKLYDDVLIGNDVVLFGFPASIGMQHSPQFDYKRPLLRSGVVAGKHAEREKIILDCPAYYGNSGGPVIEIEHFPPKEIRYRIIGIVNEFIPYSETWKNLSSGLENIQMINSGYSVIASMDAILNLIGVDLTKTNSSE